MIRSQNILIIVFVSTVLIAPQYAHSTLLHYDIECGVVKKIDESFEVVQPGTEIPFVTIPEDPERYFGCIVIPKSIIQGLNNEFTLHAEITPPKYEAKTESFNVPYLKTHNDGITTYNTAPFTFSRKGHILFRLHPSDISGKYILNIYINNIHTREVIFHVKG